jgi:hypothetical protein
MVIPVNADRWRSNFGDERLHVRFTYAGRQFYGVCCGYTQVVRVKELKKHNG